MGQTGSMMPGKMRVGKLMGMNESRQAKQHVTTHVSNNNIMLSNRINVLACGLSFEASKPKHTRNGYRQPLHAQHNGHTKATSTTHMMCMPRESPTDAGVLCRYIDRYNPGLIDRYM